MRALLCVMALAVVVALSGCAGIMIAPVSPGMGAVFSDYKAPLDLDADPTTITDKSGEAYAENFLGLVVTGDASIAAAAKEGGITRVHHIDYQYKNILGLYGKFTTIVYGE